MSTAQVSTPTRVTSRQAQVVRLIAQGFTMRGAGIALGIAERTVKQHCDNLRRELAVEHVRELPLAYMRATGDSPWPSFGDDRHAVVSGGGAA